MGPPLLGEKRAIKRIEVTHKILLVQLPIIDSYHPTLVKFVCIQVRIKPYNVIIS
jgi:hypothetical protein